MVTIADVRQDTAELRLAQKGYDAAGFIEALTSISVTDRVVQNTNGLTAALHTLLVT